jgi:hypothetical protein
MVRDTAAEAETQSQEIATTRRFDTETLRSMATLDDALAALQSAGIAVKDMSEYGDGFEMLDDKDKRQLVGVPFVIIDATESEGDYGKSFVVVSLMTRDGRKVRLTDGSTGIRDQIVRDVGGAGNAPGTLVAHGLRASDYRYCDNSNGGCGRINKDNATSCVSCGHSPLSPASTYYLDTTK